MTLGNKLSKLRKENNYTQEQLANILGISRQAISKWESDITFPETDKLIRMSDLFDCSLDYLLKDTVETDKDTVKMERNVMGIEEDAAKVNGIENEDEIFLFRRRLRERKSKRIMWGMPLWHIGKNARGVVAIGMNAKGVISVGLLSIGVLPIGLLSIGLLPIGTIALGIFAAGCFSVGIFAAGSISLGIISLGSIAFGNFSVGALAIGKYFAIGDHAQAIIAIGKTKAIGSAFQKTGKLMNGDYAAIKKLLDTIVPAYLSWAKEIIKLFL